MLNKIVISIRSLFFVVISTILILCLPSLFTNNQNVSFQPFLYAFAIEDVIYSLMKVPFSSVLPKIWSPYVYSMILLVSALLIAIVLAILCSLLYMLSNRKIKVWMRRLLFLMEAIPDVMIIVGIQALLIWFFKQTGQRPFQIINFREKQAYVIPILCLCIIPMIQLFRMLVLDLEDEQKLPYVEVVKGKGFSNTYILLVHLLRNVGLHLFHHVKSIYVFMLSNLFILEYIFNMNGIMMYLIRYGVQKIEFSFVILIMLFIPYYVLDLFGSLFLNWIRGGEEGIV